MTKAANGRSSIYKRADGWHGWVSFGEADDGHRRRKHVRGRTKREVAEKVARLEHQRDAGYVADRPLKVSEWLGMWIESRGTAGARPTTLAGYRTDQHHIVRAIGDVRLDRLTAEHVDRLWHAILAAGAGPATCAHVRRTLSAAVNVAVDRGHLARSPVRASKAPRYEPFEVEPLTTEEAGRILEVAATRCNGARWSVALALGLRQGEALGLRRKDVDLEAGIVTVRVQLQHLPWHHGCVSGAEAPTCGRDPGRCPMRHGGGPILLPLKSAAGRRVIGLPSRLKEQLLAHLEAAGPPQADRSWDELVFRGVDGSPIRKETDSAEWHRVLRLAHVRPARLHDARHTAATLLLAQGVPAGVAMRLLGHADVRILSRYQHVIDEATQSAARSIGIALWAFETNSSISD